MAVEAEILEEAAIPRGLVRVASTVAFGIDQLAHALPGFMKRYPEVEVDLTLTDDRVDVVAAGFDIALRVGPVADSSMRISRLFSFRAPVVGSPEFFDQRYRVPLKQQHIADAVGLTPEHVSRVLSQFRARGLIEFSGGVLHVLDSAEPERIGALT